MTPPPNKVIIPLRCKGATGSEREGKGFRRNLKPNPKQEIRDKAPLLFKRLGRRVNRTIGKLINNRGKNKEVNKFLNFS